MAVKNTWADGDTVHGSDLNSAADAINLAAIFSSTKVSGISAVLPASTDYVADAQLEIDSDSVIEIPATSSLEVFAPTSTVTALTSPSVYTTTVGNGLSTSFVINHNLGTRNLAVTVYNASTFEVVMCDRVFTDPNSLTLTFGSAPASGAYAVVVLGGVLLSSPNVFTQTIGDGSSTSFAINHNLGTRSVNVNIYDAATYKVVGADRTLTSVNSLTLAFQGAPSLNAYVVVVQGGALTSTSVGSTNITDASAAGLALLTGSNVTANVTMTEIFDKSSLVENVTLPASNEWMSQQSMEIGATSILEIPATSSLEVYTYSESVIRSYIDTKFSGSATAYVATAESTAQLSSGDLTTTTDQVTVTVGVSGIVQVFLRCYIANNTLGGHGFVAFGLTGANTVIALAGPTAGMSLAYQAAASNYNASIGAPFLVTGLTPGSTTFKLKYWVDAGTGTFAERRISVIPL